MAERIDKEEGYLRAKDEISRASEELDAVFVNCLNRCLFRLFKPQEP